MSSRAKLLLLIVLIAAGAVIGRSSLGAHFEAATVIATLRSLGNSAAAIPLYFLIFGLATSLFTPAVAMMITAGVTWGFWPGWLVVWGAANVWANVHFLVGRWVAGDELTRWLRQRGAAWLLRELDHGGALTTIMVRQLPFPFPLVNLAGGASPMRWRDWVVGNAVGLVPNCLIYTQLAAALADGVDGAKEAAAYRVITAAVGVIALGLVSRWLQRRFALAKGAAAQ
ncbi:MAG: VTT domain-containing protein [Archangium sp.]|nr:VTT domain-containing protein [Archangium sp.]MDP3573356.1 VTT domain-containing protein [Archangium sp.]